VRHLCAEVVDGGCPGEAGDLDIAEAVVGEVRLEGLEPLAFEDVPVGLEGAFVDERGNLCLLEGAVGTEALAVAESDLGTRRPGDTEPRPAGYALADVEEEHPGLGLGHRNGCEGLVDANRRHHLGPQTARRCLRDLRRLPG